MTDQSNPDYFPSLRFVALQSYAKNWVNWLEKEVGFGLAPKRISLFRAPVNFSDIRLRYIVAFELRNSGVDKTARNWFSHILKNPPWLKDSFREIYVSSPSTDCLHEWSFVTYIPTNVDKEFRWILYQQKDDSQQAQSSLSLLTSSPNQQLSKERTNRRLGRSLEGTQELKIRAVGGECESFYGMPIGKIKQHTGKPISAFSPQEIREKAREFLAQDQSRWICFKDFGKDTGLLFPNMGTAPAELPIRIPGTFQVGDK
jgi:hypothetical protein